MMVRASIALYIAEQRASSALATYPTTIVRDPQPPMEIAWGVMVFDLDAMIRSAAMDNIRRGL